MSHSVTVTRTTTTSGNTSYIVINTGYFKSLPGLLKLLQLLLGIVCVGLFAYYYSNYNSFILPLPRNVELFYLLMTTTFMVGTFLIVLSCLVSLGTGTIISKTIFEVVYHFFGGLLLVIAGLVVLIELTSYRVDKDQYNCYMAGGIIAIVNGVLYFVSTFFAHKSYKGV